MTHVPDNRRFYHGKSPHPFRNLCLSLLIFVVICGLFSAGITRISNRTRQEQKTAWSMRSGGVLPSIMRWKGATRRHCRI